MYSEDSKKKIYYFLSDVFAVIVSYLVLVTCYPYQFFNSKFFAILFWGLVIAVNVLTDNTLISIIADICRSYVLLSFLEQESLSYSPLF